MDPIVLAAPFILAAAIGIVVSGAVYAITAVLVIQTVEDLGKEKESNAKTK